jgi:hypothetical protein
VLAGYLGQLLAWIEANGWSGWDPYDLWDNRFGLWAMAGRSFPRRLAGAAVTRLEESFPLAIRRAAGVSPRVHAKGMGLFAAAFLELEAVEGAPRLRDGKPAYDPCFEWLESNRVTVAGGCGWGHPFNWRSRVLIPRDTPTIVNSAIVGDAYWLRYRVRGEAAALGRCEDVCRFIVDGLHRSPSRSDGAFCFSYTPVDHFQVHNANLLGAEFLVRVGLEVGCRPWVDAGLAAGRFSLGEVREDGTLNYWSNAQATSLQQDTYHSGFEIRALDGLARLTGSDEFRRAADTYFATWLREFFSADGVPCFARGRHDILEVHSCAEALLCAVAMYESHRFARAQLVDHVQRVVRAAGELWVQAAPGRGYFAWRRRHVLGRPMTTAIPLIRWGESWMCRALSAAYGALRQAGAEASRDRGVA